MLTRAFGRQLWCLQPEVQQLPSGEVAGIEMVTLHVGKGRDGARFSFEAQGIGVTLFISMLILMLKYSTVYLQSGNHDGVRR